MGTKYLCICKQCGLYADPRVGVGMFYSRTYQELVENIKEGMYGKEWRAFFEKYPNGAVDGTICFFVCKNCKDWKTEYNLSLFQPVDGNKPVDNDYWVWDQNKYKLYKKYPHICKKCNHQMEEIQKIEDMKNCPICGGNIQVEDILSWD